MDNKVNLFKTVYRFRLRNIPYMVKEKVTACKMMWQRARYGVSDWDVTDLGTYLDGVIYNSLNKFITNKDKFVKTSKEDKELEKEILCYFRECCDIDYEDDNVGSFEDIYAAFMEHQDYRDSQRYEGMQQLLKYWNDLWY